MKIIYQCEICGSNHKTAKEAEECEAQPYTPHLAPNTPVLHRDSIHRVGRHCLHFDHTHSYLLSRSVDDNDGQGYNTSQGFTHEREFTTLADAPETQTA